MELQIVNNSPEVRSSEISDKCLIEANTLQTSLEEIKNDHIIPVFIKDNEPLISHADFVDGMLAIVTDVYGNECISQPNIRVSHPVKGRLQMPKISQQMSLTSMKRPSITKGWLL